MKILLVSDNHGDKNILQKILQKESYDLAIHCGDAQISENFLDQNFDYWVPGNGDYYQRPLEISTTIGGLKTLILHGHTRGIYVFTQFKPVSQLLANHSYDLILHGHTHIFRHDTIDQAQVICPGSTTYPRGPEGKGYAIITIDNQRVTNVKFKSI